MDGGHHGESYACLVSLLTGGVLVALSVGPRRNSVSKNRTWAKAGYVHVDAFRRPLSLPLGCDTVFLVLSALEVARNGKLRLSSIWSADYRGLDCD